MQTGDPCFHCGEPLPSGPVITATLAGQPQPMCCIGCKAVAEFIDNSGLQAFYTFRDRPADADVLTPAQSDWSHYDSTELLARYVSQRDVAAEASIDIGGMYCSACVWLLQKALLREAAVTSIDVNPAVKRAVIRWDPTDLPFSGLLRAIEAIGFKPAPVGVTTTQTTNTDEYRLALKRLIVAAAAGMQVMMFAVALYAGDYFGIDAGIEHFLRLISLLVTLPIVLYSARPFFAAAWRGVRLGAPGMDLPVAIAIGAAFVASTYTTLSRGGEIYFDSVAMFVFFLSATRFLEMRARHRSGDHATALAQMLPDVAVRLEDGKPVQVALDRVQVDDQLSIVPGNVLPVDGVITAGSLDIDESLLSGESLPVLREAGEPVFAGALVRTGNATVQVTQVGASTNLAEIGRMLERARSDRPPIALLADRIATKFVLAVLLIAAAAGWYWYVRDAARSFEVVLATLVVTCPCALALATPAALAAAASRLAKHGFLLVRSRILAVLARPVTIVFDKTGTLTAGQPQVVAVKLLVDGLDQNAAMNIAAAIESASEHVLARAFPTNSQSRQQIVADAMVVTGFGVEGTLGGKRYRIGKADFAAALSGTTPPVANPDSTATRIYLGDEHRLLAIFDVGDALRDDALTAVRDLKARGFTLVIASGDQPAAVAAVAEHLGISTWHAALTPADKLQLLASLQRESDVIMVGDGINDAPVLAAADASIALDSGTALARASADAVSLGRRLGTINTAATIAGRTQRVIRQNIGWSIFYNTTAIPLAVSGLLQPWMAAVGMSLSSLLVVLNALRLQRSGD